MNYQVNDIIKGKDKACAVLLKTRKQLEEVAAKAGEFLVSNRNKISSLNDEIHDLNNVNGEILKQISSIELSIDETNKILNPIK